MTAAGGKARRGTCPTCGRDLALNHTTTSGSGVYTVRRHHPTPGFTQPSCPGAGAPIPDAETRTPPDRDPTQPRPGDDPDTLHVRRALAHLRAQAELIETVLREHDQVAS